MKENNRYCVIMCGGVGARFWPVSRTVMPKQFIDFLGTGRSLLRMTVDRIAPLVPAENIILVTNGLYRDLVRAQLPEIPESNILCEPARRNTAPCILWAASHIEARCPDAVVMTLPSDHLVLRERAFLDAMERGCDFAADHDVLLTLGIRPTAPNTGYGYIQKGESASCGLTYGDDSIMKAKTFVEKPDSAMAELFLQSGEFLWNSGIFIGRADVILDAFRRHMPEMAAQFAAGSGSYATPDEPDFIEKVFPRAANISIDYAIMEKASNVYVLEADLGWSDLGSWRALYEASPRNQEGNVMQNCRVIAHNCSDTLFAVSADKIIVASGLKDYVVAESGNALLIYPLAEQESIRHIANEVASRFGENFI